MKKKIEYAIYGYEPNVFLPIRVDGKLSNKLEFIHYKLNRIVNRLKPVD